MKNTVIGQQKIKDLFLQLVAKDTLGHCYTLVGDEGMGKSVLADYIAKTIVCEFGTACGSCKACVMAEADTHPDIEYVVPEEDKKFISVDVMRAMIENIYVRPYSARKKVIIIKNFDLARVQAQNAVLKVLEEPPDYITFLLTVPSEKDMLDTVKSRSVMLRLQPYGEDEIKRFLRENTSVSESELDFISAYAAGNTGKGKRLAENEDFSALRSSVFDALFAAVENRNVMPFSAFAKKDNSGIIGDILECTLSFFRDMLMYKIGREELAANRDYADRIAKCGGKIKTQRILQVMQDIMDADANLRQNINFNLSVMNVVLGSLEEING